METLRFPETAVHFYLTTRCHIAAGSTLADGLNPHSEGYGLDDRGMRVRAPVGSRMSSFPRRVDRLWGPPNLFLNGTGGAFLGGKAAGARSWPLISG
jgi:hypothetical protein